MNEILSALGRKDNLWERARVLGLIGSAAVGFTLLRVLACELLPWAPLLIQAAGWGAWFLWQGWRFALNRERYLRQDPDTAYRQAFYKNIVPGLGFWMSQMGSPLVIGATLDPKALVMPEEGLGGLLLLAFGLSLLGLGFQAVGLGGAGFVYEYRPAERPLTQCSIYSFIRHPLFLGGALASLGGGLIFDGSLPLLLGLVNVAVLPIYGRLEDARQARIFGDDYRSYCRTVGRFFPRPVMLADALGAAWNRLGSSVPRGIRI